MRATLGRPRGRRCTTPLTPAQLRPSRRSRLFMEHLAQQRHPHRYLCKLPDVPSPATLTSPPAKRMQKAARRRCEAELLHDSDTDDELQLLPFSQYHPAPFPPVSPASPTPIYSDAAPALSPPPDPTSLLTPSPNAGAAGHAG